MKNLEARSYSSSSTRKKQTLPQYWEDVQAKKQKLIANIINAEEYGNNISSYGNRQIHSGHSYKRPLTQGNLHALNNANNFFKNLDDQKYSTFQFQETSTTLWMHLKNQRQKMLDVPKSKSTQQKRRYKLNIMSNQRNINMRENQSGLGSRTVTSKSEIRRVGNSIDIYSHDVLNSMEKKRVKKQPTPIPIQKQEKLSPISHNKYLKKGKAINQAILLNILRSKINKTVAESGQNFASYEANQKYISAIKQQIPIGLRDVIGAQQILRMSNIFTGSHLKSNDLHKSVNKIISDRHNKRKEKAAKQVEDDQFTLKSVKRW